MRAIYEISLNTFKETLRNHVVYMVLLFVVILILLSVSFGDWSVFARIQVIEDFGLATMSISGLLLAVFLGVGMLGKEISSKTVYHVITKPIARYQFIIGKFAGLLAVLALNYAVMSLFFAGTLLFLGGHAGWMLASAIICIGTEMAVIISAALFFSTFTSSVLAALFSIAFYCAGHLNDLISIGIASKSWSLFPVVLKILYYLLPNLEHFNIRNHVVYHSALPTAGYTPLAVAYGGLYVILFLVLSCIIFRKKDL
jgi:ABC-type transport system involved in multi-copper enzyme maturation permease subunit